MDFDSIYERWFDDVVRWSRTLGAPDGELQDVAQNVFLVVRRKLADFDGNNMGGWLYRITAYEVRGLRRRAWFRHLLHRGDEGAIEEIAATDDGGPGRELARKDAARRLRALVDRLPEARRVTFLLFELEGYGGEEIAALHGVPVNTVWTRLHHARRDLEKLVGHARRRGESWNG